MFEVFQFDFMVRAFIAGIAVAITAPLVGIFLVVRRYSFMADALAHLSLLGAVIGFLTNIYPLFTAALVSVISGFGMEKLRRNKKFAGDAVLALFLSGGLAIAVVLIGVARGTSGNLFGFLFGSITIVSRSDLFFMLSLCIFTIAMVVGLYKELFLVSLDEEIAQANGIHADRFNLIMVLLAALSVSLSIKIVGALLIGALMVIPVMTAMQFGKGFKETIILSLLFSVASAVIGLFLSYYAGWASGGTIVLVALIMFLSSLLVTKK